MDAAKQINYRPSMLARSLRLKKTMTIGLIVPDIKNPFFGEIAWRTEILLREHGYSTIICNTDGVRKNEKFYLRTLCDREVDGMLIVPIHTEEWAELQEICQRKSVVLMVRSLNDTSLPCVISDNRQAAEDLTAEVISLGYRQIAFLGGEQGTFINTSRLSGYRDALKAYDIPYNKDIVFNTEFSVDAGEKMMHSVMERSPGAEAVFCVNNQVFLGVMKAMNESDSEDHDNTMIAAFDIARHSGLFQRPLISANQNLESLTDTSVSLIIDVINNKPIPDCPINLPVQISKYNI